MIFYCLLLVYLSSYNIMSNGFHVHQHKKVSFFLRSASKNGKQKHIPSTNSNNNNKNISKKVSSSSSPSPSSGYRINKCLTNLSRRAADQAIVEGRVTVNGKVATPGQMVNAGSIVKLDNQVQHFKTLMKAKLVVLDESELEDRNFIYLKYWKPIGVTCTSDPNDSSNLISAGRFDLFPQRLFSVGRLDKDSTGLILVTSDGRVNNALLSPSVSKEKVYEVRLNKSPSDADIAKLRDGVVITTVSQKDSGAKSVTAKTLPCKVTRNIRDSNTLEIVLTEGRNRQIRKMAEAIGYEVVSLHRTSFCGITLSGLSSGNWKELSGKEIKIISNALEKVAIRNNPKPDKEDNAE